MLKILRGYVLPCIVASVAGGCIVMNRVKDVPVNPETFRHYQETRPNWTIQSDSIVVHDVLVRNIDEDKVVLSVGEVQTKEDHPRYGTTHPIYWRRFGRFKIKHFHLHVPPGTINQGLMEIPFSGITAARTHFGSWTTIPASLLTTGVVGGAFLLVACNCPRVMVLGTEGWNRVGALFPGAISKGLERRDNLVLRNVKSINDKVIIRIANELPETEFIDEVSLYELTGLAYPNLATLNNVPVSYANPQRPLLALNGTGAEVTNKVIDPDSSHYDFDEMDRFDELNKVYLKFSGIGGKNQPILLVNVKQSPWIETVGEYFFQQFGKKFDKWVERLDETDPGRYGQDQIERGISLNAYVKDEGTWKYAGSFETVGTQSGRMLALLLRPEYLKGNDIEVKLESAFELWELDYAALTAEWSTDIRMSKLKMVSATDQSGQDVSAKINSDDQSYLLQPASSSFVDLKFVAPSRSDAVLMLSGTGYYHHERNYAHDPNTKLLREFKRDPISTHQLSRTLKAQLAPSFAVAAGNK